MFIAAGLFASGSASLFSSGLSSETVKYSQISW